MNDRNSVGAGRRYSGGTLKNHQTLVTTTSVKAEILNEIPEN
jgi:hypothetical protein